MQSEVVLMNELAAITDQAAILRRDRMAIARVSIRKISQDNLQLMQNVLWSLLAMAMIGLSALNSIQRTGRGGDFAGVRFWAWQDSLRISLTQHPAGGGRCFSGNRIRLRHRFCSSSGLVYSNG